MFPQEIGIGRFQPYGRYTYVNSVYYAGAGLDEYEAGLNYIISGFNARFSAFYRTGTLDSNGGPTTSTGVTNPSAKAKSFTSTGLAQSSQHVDSFILALQMQY